MQQAGQLGLAFSHQAELQWHQRQITLLHAAACTGMLSLRRWLPFEKFQVHLNYAVCWQVGISWLPARSSSGNEQQQPISMLLPVPVPMFVQARVVLLSWSR